MVSRLQVKSDAEIAATEAALAAARREEYAAGQAARAADMAAARRDFDETLASIVECTVELSGLLAALEERERQARLAGVVTLPNTYVGGLRDVVKRTIWLWDRQTDFTGKAAERETPERRAVREAEAQLTQHEGQYAAAMQRVEAFTGSRSEPMFRSLLTLLDNVRKARQQSRAELGMMLRRLGEQTTQADRERIAQLAEAEQERVTLPL